MQIKMIVNAFGSGNKSGNASVEYKEGTIIDCKEEWQVTLGHSFVESGFAMLVKITEPTETKAVKKKVAKKKATKKK